MIVLAALGALASWILACRLAPWGVERMAIFVVLLAANGAVFHIAGASWPGTALLLTSAGFLAGYTLLLLWRVHAAQR